MNKPTRIIATLFCSSLLVVTASYAKAGSLTQLVIDTVREARKVETASNCSANPHLVGNDGLPLAPACAPVVAQCPARTTPVDGDCDVVPDPTWPYPMNYSYTGEDRDVSYKTNTVKCNSRVYGGGTVLDGYSSGGCILFGSQYGEDIEVTTYSNGTSWYGVGRNSGLWYELSQQGLSSGQLSCRSVTVRSKAICLRKPPEATLRKLESIDWDLKF